MCSWVCSEDGTGEDSVSTSVCVPPSEVHIPSKKILIIFFLWKKLRWWKIEVRLIPLGKARWHPLVSRLWPPHLCGIPDTYCNRSAFSPHQSKQSRSSAFRDRLGKTHSTVHNCTGALQRYCECSCRAPRQSEHHRKVNHVHVWLPGEYKNYIYIIL